MKKKNIIVYLTIIILLLSADPVYSEIVFKEEHNEWIDYCSNIYYPLDKLIEEFKYDCIWKQENNSAVIKDNYNTYELKENHNFIKINDKEIEIYWEPKIIDEKLYISLETISMFPEIIVFYDEEINNLILRKSRDKNEKFFTKKSGFEQEKNLKSFLNEMEDGRGFSGNILIADNNEIILNESYGYANKKEKIHNNKQNKFSIGSITKQFTALGIMQLEERGLLSVEDKLWEYYPEIKGSKKISIHDMLVHSSGLYNFTNLDEFYKLDYNKASDEEIIDIFKDINLEFEPGKYFNYSNTNYFLLGKIIEDVSGVSYEDYLQNNIFRPLDMKDSGTHRDKDFKKLETKAYSGYLESKEIDDNIVVKLSGGAGSMYSTTEDLYRWDRALNTEKLVKKETLDKIFKGHELIDYHLNIPVKIGYGWFVLNDKGLVEHGGNTLGYSSEIIKNINNDKTYIILSNLGHYDLSKILYGIDKIIWDKEFVKVKKHIEIYPEDNKIYEDYIGQYKFFEGNIINIIQRDKKLYAQLTDQDEFQIFYLGRDEFFAKIVDVEIHFIREGGRVDSLILKQSGLELTAEKIIKG